MDKSLLNSSKHRDDRKNDTNADSSLSTKQYDEDNTLTAKDFAQLNQAEYNEPYDGDDSDSDEDNGADAFGNYNHKAVDSTSYDDDDMFDEDEDDAFNSDDAYNNDAASDDDDAYDHDVYAQEDIRSKPRSSLSTSGAKSQAKSTSFPDRNRAAARATSFDDAEDGEDLISFDQLALSNNVLKAIKHEGFELPTPIQAQAIPTILSGADMIGQAQTGTGKTAAFALPILSKLPPKQKKIFALVLEPTRELALQVAESFSRFARYIDNFRVAPIYGGASYDSQIRNLHHGVQVVVATPGRLIDLLEKKLIDLSGVEYVVLDEADEMLRMGFIEDVSWILDQAPQNRQTALFSATMPPAIRKVAEEHLIDPEIVHIESHTTTATTVRQRYWVVSGVHKIDAMCRMLEVESYEAVLVFVRTKVDAEDVANKLSARGLACAALHGDIPQRQREKIIERLKKGFLDIIIATDVAARGLDVDRITHVFNYDIPYDAESYVHRIGRTGRAGRRGEAILFVSPRERRALRQIERITRQKIEPMRMPTVADVNKRRLENFRNQIIETIDAGGLEDYLEVVSDILSDDSIEPEMLAAALAKLCQRDGSLLLDEKEEEPVAEEPAPSRQRERRSGGPSPEPVPLRDFPEIKMVRYRLAVGRRDGVKPGQIVGAIANEGDIDSKFIGDISIYDTFSIVDLPTGMPKETMQILANARVCGRALELREYTLEPPRKRQRPTSTANDKAPERRGSTRSEERSARRNDDFNFDIFDEDDDFRDRPRKGGKRGSLDLVSPPRGQGAGARRSSAPARSRSGSRRGY